MSEKIPTTSLSRIINLTKSGEGTSRTYNLYIEIDGQSSAPHNYQLTTSMSQNNSTAYAITVDETNIPTNTVEIKVSLGSIDVNATTEEVVLTLISPEGQIVFNPIRIEEAQQESRPSNIFTK